MDKIELRCQEQGKLLKNLTTGTGPNKITINGLHALSSGDILIGWGEIDYDGTSGLWKWQVNTANQPELRKHFENLAIQTLTVTQCETYLILLADKTRVQILRALDFEVMETIYFPFGVSTITQPNVRGEFFVCPNDAPPIQMKLEIPAVSQKPQVVWSHAKQTWTQPLVVCPNCLETVEVSPGTERAFCAECKHEFETDVELIDYRSMKRSPAHFSLTPESDRLNTHAQHANDNQMIS